MHGHNRLFIGGESNAHVTGDVNWVVIIIAKDDNNIAGIQFEIDFFLILPLVNTAHWYYLYRQLHAVTQWLQVRPNGPGKFVFQVCPT